MDTFIPKGHPVPELNYGSVVFQRLMQEQLYHENDWRQGENYEKYSDYPPYYERYTDRAPEIY